MSTATSITVRVPLAIRRRPGRKTVVTPVCQQGDTVMPIRADPALMKALARAFRYQRLLDEGRYASISEMAAAEQIERGYLGSLLRLTLLAPDIVEAILDRPQSADLALPSLLHPLPAEWARQRDHVFGSGRPADSAAPRPPAAARIGAAPVRRREPSLSQHLAEQAP